jgi:metal-responsive CopG/Arc/MetJ family transcriptional regulator
MPKIKTAPQIEFRLLGNDHVRFDDICRVKGKKRSELAREAVKWYLDNEENLAADSRETLLEKRMKRMEDRMAALQARTAIDVGMIFHIMYRNMEPEKRDDVVTWAYNGAIERLKKKLEGQAADVKEAMKGQEQAQEIREGS